jgi:hypothetical protein
MRSRLNGCYMTLLENCGGYNWVTRTMRRMVLIAVLAACSACAAEVQLYFSVLQRVLAEQAFTREGRLYVRGHEKEKCNFAYLENPIVAADGHRLIINARFTGRSAANFFGTCVGFGDSFDLRIGAVPQYRDGFLAFGDVRVESPGREGFYARRVRAAMADSLTKQFRYNLAAEAKKILEEPKPKSAVKQELRRFSVREIRVLPDSVLLVFDFQLGIR